MKLKYPAEAFALGIVLFSAGMKEAFAAGILVIAAVVFAEFLKNLLEPFVPLWSVRLSVLIGTGSICASAFLLGFSQLGIEVNNGLWIMTFIVGLLAAKHVLMMQNMENFSGNLGSHGGSGFYWRQSESFAREAVFLEIRFLKLPSNQRVFWRQRLHF